MTALFPVFAMLDTSSPWLLGAWMVLLILLLSAGALMNLLGMAGNWLMLTVALGHRLLVDPVLRVGYGWGLVAMLCALALLGEGLEFLAGVIGAGKAGGSRRGILLSVLGGMVGSILGLSAGTAVLPVLGSLAGILLGGAVGSFAGAVLGECWKGSDAQTRKEVGKAAFWGRIFGTLAKSMIGTLMYLLSIAALLS